MYLYFAMSHLDVYGLQSLQGRYLLPALAPLALLTAEGWDLLVERVHRRGATAAAIAGLLVFDVASLATLASHYSRYLATTW